MKEPYLLIGIDGNAYVEPAQKPTTLSDVINAINAGCKSLMENKFVLLEATCIHCHRTFKFSVDITKYEQWRDGNILIQDAFPELTPGERELLLSGLCGECFDKVFNEGELF